MTEKRMVMLGALPSAERHSLRIEERILELEKFMLYEKRYSKCNVQHHIARMKQLITMYQVGLEPCPDDAIRIEEALKARNIQPATVRHYLRALELISESQGVPLKLKKPKAVSKVYDIPSLAECRGMMTSCTNLRDLGIISTLLYTGVRNKELINMDMEDFDAKNKILYVRDRGEDIKSRHERPEVLTKECLKAIQDWIKVRQPETDTRALFITWDGRRLTKDRLGRIVREVKEKAGIEKRIYPHLLRHTCGTMMLRSGVSLPDVAKQLGHRSLASTMIYLHSDIESLKESVNKNFRY